MKKPLVALATVPRVVGPDEQVVIPVSVFALEDNITKVKVDIVVEGPVDIDGTKTQEMVFSGIGDKMTQFHLKVRPELGIAKITVNATSGKHTATQTTEVDIRHPTQRATDVLARRIVAGGDWSSPVALVGMAGTREVELELSKLPPLNLGKRLGSLIRYPHGCAEQTTSGAFPQVYLSKLTTLTPDQSSQVSGHIEAAIARLGSFQTGTGGYGYSAGGYAMWPSGYQPNDWATSYVGHFLLEAERAGFIVPAERRASWVAFQQDQARRWSHDQDEADLLQAYRLYTLALAGSPELGAMNRLKEVSSLSDAAAWRLAAAYQLAGQSDAAKKLIAGRAIDPVVKGGESASFASTLRNRALILETLVMLDDNRADSVAADVADKLSSDAYASTQGTAYGLIALARYGIAKPGESFDIQYTWGDGKSVKKTVTDKIARISLPVGASESMPLTVNNPSGGDVFVQVITSGLPAVGYDEPGNSGLTIKVAYEDADGRSVDPLNVTHGTDMLARVTVVNSGRSVKDLALTHVVASGWEIHGLKPGTGREFTYRDVRDDRVMTYFDLDSGGTVTYTVPVNASYLGRFYLPPVQVEHMYDDSIYARNAGQWVNVNLPDGPS